MCSPVAIFVYNRVDNTKTTIQSLLANTLARETDVFVFSDGVKVNDEGLTDEKSKRGVDEVRTYLRQLSEDVRHNGGFKSLTLIERERNIYLEENILTGIDCVFQSYDTVIVLEDDISTSPYFLQYMNDAFRLYQDEHKVMHVSGFTNLDLWKSCDGQGYNGRDFYFTPHMSGWGWGTWKNRWERFFRHYSTREEALADMSDDDLRAFEYGGAFPCLKSLDKTPIPWDICWELAIYKEGGLCLTPSHTMVRNTGLRNGTHFRSFDILQKFEYDRVPSTRLINVEKVDNPEKDPLIEGQFAVAIKDWGIRYTLLGKIIRFFYKKLKVLAIVRM